MTTDPLMSPEQFVFDEAIGFDPQPMLLVATFDKEKLIDSLKQRDAAIRAAVLRKCADLCDNNAKLRASQQSDARMFESVMLRDKILSLHLNPPETTHD